MQGQAAVQMPVWVSIREQRLSTTKGSRRQSFYLQFFLVAANGKETLAAVGEDQGTATKCSVCTLLSSH